MSIEMQCAGLWLAFGHTVVDGVRTEVVYKFEEMRDGMWSVFTTFPRIDAEQDRIVGWYTLRSAIKAAEELRSWGYRFA